MYFGMIYCYLYSGCYVTIFFMKHQTTNILRLANTVRQNIQTEKLINSNVTKNRVFCNNHLLITFSGGQDSAFCLLVLYLLNNLEKKWNCKKVLDLSDHYSKNNTLIKLFNSNLSLSSCRYGKQSIFYLSQTRALFAKLRCLQKRSFACRSEAPYRLTNQRFVIPVRCKNVVFAKANSFCNQKISVTPLYRKSNANFLTSNHKLTKQSFPFSKRKVNVKTKKLISNQVTPLIDTYTLLWCNHFWQKDTFFTMEHVFKLSFSKNYTMHSFAPVKKILSEQNARHWRHKVMQRLSLFLLKRNSQFVELYFNYVFITAPFLLTRSKKQNNGLCFLSNKNEFIQPSNLPELYSLQKRNLCEDITNVKPKFCKARVSKKRSFFYGEPTAPSLSEQLCVQGHNKSDRAEAILFNLMRGTGMNGLSTLQWKHTFSPPSNSNSKFYPIFSDFFKEIQIICLNSLFMKTRLVLVFARALQKRSFCNAKLCKTKFCTNKAKRNPCKTSSLKKETIFRSSFNKNFFFVQPAKIVPKNRNDIQPKKRIASSQSGMLFSKNSMVSTEQSYNDRLDFAKPSKKKFFFYYQLKYKKII